MGGTTVKTPAPVQPPPPTEEELAIQREQLKALQNQNEQFGKIQPLFEESLRAGAEAQAYQEQLKPYVLEGLGFRENPDGSLRKLTEEEFQATLTDVDKQQRQNLLLSLERDRKALAGELPITEATKQQEAKEFRAFKEAMARAGNPIQGDTPESATASTTAGAQGLRQFRERFSLVREAERFGQLDRASQSVLQRLGVAEDIGASRRAGLLQFPGASTAGTQYAPPDYSGLSRDYAGLLQPYQYNRGLQQQANLGYYQAQVGANAQTAANKTALYSGLLGAGGTAAGALAAAAFLSKRSSKKNIRRATRREEEKALRTVRGLKTYTFRYKWEHRGTPKRMGLMADEAPAEIVTPDRSGLDVGRTVGLLIGATRAMARKNGRRSKYNA